MKVGIATLAKVKNNALENDLNDCKEACKITEGCIGFVQTPDTVCINLNYINLHKCDRQTGYTLFVNGMYTTLNYKLAYNVFLF